MSSTTTRLGLYKPDAAGTEFVSVVTDLNNNLDSLDAKVGAFSCTSGTRPGAPFNGQFIRETDTGKMYCCTNTVGPIWTQVHFGTAQFAESVLLPVAKQFNVGGSASSASFTALRAAAADDVFSSGVGADTVYRHFVRADGTHLWGPGGATALDLNLYRSGVATLKTDNSFVVGAALTVSGSSTFADANVTGNLNIGSARYRNQLSTATTVANTTAESTLASMTLPAADPVVGTVYRIRAWGSAAVTGTPTLTFRFRLAATTVLLVAFPAITARSGMTDGQWSIEAYVAVPAIGVSGTWAPMMQMQHNFITSATTWTPLGPATATPVTQDTTTVNAPQITVQWSAASASNTITCRGYSAERVA